MAESRPLLILGTGVFAYEIADLASEIPGWRVAGFVENLEREKCDQRLLDLPVYWVDEIAPLIKDHLAVCSLGTTHRYKFIEQVSQQGMQFATLVHPTARISKTSTLGEGVIAGVGVIVASHTRIGAHVRLNRGVLVGHHTSIGDFSTVQPGANIAGLCEIERASYIGMGAIVQDRVKIGTRTVVGAGAVVTRDVPDRTQVVGVPARVVKENIEGL